MRNQPSRGIKTFIVVASAVLSVIVLAFTGLLEMMSFRQNYTHSLVSSYVVIAQQPVRKIEFALKYGKPLDHFYGMDRLLSEIVQNSPAIESAQVVLPNAHVIYDTHGMVQGQSLPTKVGDYTYFSATSQTSDYHVVATGHSEYVLVPVFDKQKVVADVVLRFPKSLIDGKVNHYQLRLILTLVALGLFSLLVMILLARVIPFFDEHDRIRKRRVLVVVLTVLTSAQLVFGLFSYQLLVNGYLNSVKQNTKLVVKVIQEDIASVAGKGVPYSGLNNLGTYMKQIIEVVPEVQSVSVVNADYTTNPNLTTNVLSAYTYSTPLQNDSDGNSTYSCIVNLSPHFIGRQTREILLDTLTMLVVSFFLSYEFTVGAIWFLRKRTAKTENEQNEIGLDRTGIRPVGFLTFAALYLSASFIPLLMGNLYHPIAGIPKDIVLALPISTEMAFTAISAIIAGNMIDRRGWKGVFLAGGVLLIAGALVSGLAANEWLFICARGLVGAGFGASLVAMQNFVVQVDSEEAKNEGLNALNAGAYAGINSGTVVGGMLGDHIGLSNVFFVGVAIMSIAVYYAWRFIPQLPQRNMKKLNRDAVAPMSTWAFIRQKPIRSFFTSVLLPMSVSGMFLYYFFPLFSSQSHVSTANIGRAFLLNGLCIVYIGPWLAKFLEGRLGSKRATVLAGFFTALALLSFALTRSVAVAFLVVILMGMSDGFGVTSQINYFIGTREAIQLGEGKAMGVYSLVENIGQMVGPLLFGSLASLGTGMGVGAISGILFIGIIAFMFTGRMASTTAAMNLGGTNG